MSGNSKKIIAFNYFGGKFTILEELYGLFPKQFTHLVDLFAGSCVVSLNYPGQVIKTANELNEEITNFFRVLRDNEQELISLLELTPCSKAEFDNSYDKTGNDIEDARRFYIRVRQSFFALGAHRRNKGWHMAKSQFNAHGGETVSKWNNAIPKLHDVAQALRQNLQVTNFDYAVCIDKIDNSNAFFYCDPPYLKKVRKSFGEYKYEFTEAQHIDLSEKLHKIQGKAMVSGYYSDLYADELYKDWHMTELKVRKNNIRSSDVKEIVWTNYEPESDFIQPTLFF